MIDNLRFAFDGGFQVLWVGLLLGAGLPLLFALGIRSLALGAASDAETGAGTATVQVSDRTIHPVGQALAVLCFGAVVLAVALGITVIVGAGFGKVISFEHVYPTLVPKG